jgi:serine/threonine-protein kinase
VPASDPFLAALHGAGAVAGTDTEQDVVEDLISRVRSLRRPAAPSGASGVTGRDTSRPAAREVREALAAPREPDELGRFGRYGILRVLGSGGMGVVLEAREEATRRALALKMILTGPAGVEQLSRFHSEPEIVARLRHPNIVQVHEVGTHAGRPYFTMEYVAGGSLAARLAAAPLAPREAAELLRTLAEAVQFAHGQGVVHRDLKPANVLLTADGTPKISDFGLAKRIEAGEGLTQTGAILGTPGYMAPEQAASLKDAGPAADVYALGAILYECLTGRPPFKAASVLETLEQARTREPVPPSRLQPGLPRDLETICLECLQKEPTKRYPSAGDLADDLGRFLRGEPIRARRASRRERLVRWARRRPAAAALVVLGLVSLLAAAGGLVVHNAQLERARVQAETNEAEARRQRGLADGRYQAARDSLAQILEDMNAPRLADVPRLQELRQQSLEHALAFYQAVLAQADDPDPAVRRDAAFAYAQTGALQFLLNRPGPAVENLRRALALLEDLPAEDRDRPECRAREAACHGFLGFDALVAGRPQEAERHFRAECGLCERLAREEPGKAEWQDALAQAEHHLGRLCQSAPGRAAEAEAHYERAVALRTRLVEEHPDVAAYQAHLAETCVNLAVLTGSGRRWQGRDPPAEALEVLDRAVEMAEAALRQEPRHIAALGTARNAHAARAEMYQDLGTWAEAVKDWDRVVEVDTGSQAWVNRAMRAFALARAGDHARAAAEAEALEGRPEVTDDGRYNLACVWALAAGPARADSRLPADHRQPLAERYAARAVAVLGKLRAQGYFRDATHARDLAEDPDLQALRGRPDFRRLLEKTTNNKP